MVISNYSRDRGKFHFERKSDIFSIKLYYDWTVP
jgi:hypothetical protein